MLRQVGRLAAPIVDGLAESVTIAGACVSIPALLRHGSGVVQLAPNLGWHDVDVLDVLAETRCAARDSHCSSATTPTCRPAPRCRRAPTAERTSRDAQSFLYIAGEVGIGGAIVVAGELARGQHGWSGEIGHAVIERDGPLCGCGAHGCLEQYAGRDVIMRSAGLPLDAPVETLLEAAARPGRPSRALAAAADAIGVAVATTLNLVDVERVVLGGIYARLFDHLRDGISAQVADRVLAARWSPVEIGPALGRARGLARRRGPAGARRRRRPPCALDRLPPGGPRLRVAPRAGAPVRAPRADRQHGGGHPCRWIRRVPPAARARRWPS